MRWYSSTTKIYIICSSVDSLICSSLVGRPWFMILLPKLVLVRHATNLLLDGTLAAVSRQYLYSYWSVTIAKWLCPLMSKTLLADLLSTIVPTFFTRLIVQLSGCSQFCLLIRLCVATFFIIKPCLMKCYLLKVVAGFYDWRGSLLAYLFS